MAADGNGHGLRPMSNRSDTNHRRDRKYLAQTRRDPKLFLSDCDEVAVRTALPLAAVHVANHLFWVLEEHGYEDETYLIAEIGPTSVRYPIEVNGGGC
jgi:hypothetical protein